MTRRRLILFGLLALTIAASVWDPSNGHEAQDNVALPVRREVRQQIMPMPTESQTSTASSQRVSLPLAQLERPIMSVGDLNPFGVKSWFVPPRPSPSPSLSQLPPPKPSAPPLPFIYAGKFEEEGGRWIVYLVKGEQLYAVTKGETFSDVYRFEGIRNGNVVIQYLPLSIKQLLPIGADS